MYLTCLIHTCCRCLKTHPAEGRHTTYVTQWTKHSGFAGLEYMLRGSE